MAKPNYSFEKRKREAAKRAKKEAKKEAKRLAKEQKAAGSLPPNGIDVPEQNGPVGEADAGPAGGESGSGDGS